MEKSRLPMLLLSPVSYPSLPTELFIRIPVTPSSFMTESWMLWRISSANGKPVLVAYWFKHDLSRIKKRFDVREIKSSKDITDWNAGKIPVAVIHPASAGHGLNLQAGGSTLIWFGLTWSLELYQQTNARLWRQGQTSGTVVIEHIITKGTIDERILKALSKKELTQNALIDAVKANL